MTFSVKINITLRESILDPQGKATQHALQELGFNGIESVRIGKLVELTIEAEDEQEAEQRATEAAQKLLANPVMEDFTVQVASATAAAS